ncbi:MAG TPA: hypothetical protein VNA25_05620 [Phycisphaerae bacterium]|nr:hypothetical protein [Phycisphaerae bacterium]
MNGHTPGPWEWWPGTLGGVVSERNGNHIAVPARGMRREANARLIAAAPELLDMLKTIENDAGQVPEWLWGRIQDVIEKAEGRTP